MTVHLNIDEKLLQRAKELGGHRTKRETVNDALAEYVRVRDQLKVLDLAGKVDYDAGYNYKKQRSRI